EGVGGSDWGLEQASGATLQEIPPVRKEGGILVCYTRSIVIVFTTKSFNGLSCLFLGAFTIFSTTFSPSTSSPKIVCLPVNHSVGAMVIKNCEPFVFGPAFAIASLPGLSNLWGEPLVSSSN